MKNSIWASFSWQHRVVLAVATFAIVQAPPTVLGQSANLAVVATPTASYTSGDTDVSALNDGNEPRRSRDRRGGSYGNWPRRGTQWVQYEWSRPIATNKVDVYWWDDNQGVRAPEAARLLYWKDDEFVAVPTDESVGVSRNQFNTLEFPEIRTTKLRLEIDGAGTNSTGVLEWRVFDSGASPDFEPIAHAGVDRTVIVGGKTFLNGAARAVPREDDVQVEWTKKSGPGEVQFANPNALATTATVTEPGEYELELKASIGDLSSTSSLALKAVSPPADEPLENVPTQKYKISSTFWKPRIKAIVVNWIPYCIDRISDPNLREGGINNFVDAAKKMRGEEAHEHRGYWFSNAWVYNTIESICMALSIDPEGDEDMIAAQEKMRETLEDWIPAILAAQEPDGFLQTLSTINGNRRWSNKIEHEGYNAGYFLEAATAHYRLTGGEDTRLYDAAKKLADCWYENIGPAPKKPWYNGHQAMEMALARFGRLVDEVEGDGAGDRYRELSKFLLDQRGGGEEYDQSHLPVVQQYEAVGHAVRAVYSYAGMADVVIDTGDRDYHSAVESIWDNIVNRKYYVTGGVGSGETSEGFGPDYSLRNNAYCESCSSCGEIFLQQKLGRIHHQARYADLYEATLYNALLGSLDLEGRNFFYTNPLDARRSRHAWHNCPCCIGNIPRTLLQLPTWTYATDDEGVYVNLFFGGTVRLEDVAGGEVTLVQETEYPWDGKVKITVNPAESRQFAVRVRIPDRDISELYTATPEADGLQSLAVNGDAIDINEENGYATIDRKWESGDTIEFEVPMVVQRIYASDKIDATRGQVALRYGPLIYNIESVDQDVQKSLPKDAELTTEWQDDLLGGVLTIRGKFSDGSDMLAIPNYARLNRDERGNRSVVWIREEP